METFHHIDYEHTKQWINEMSYIMCPMSSVLEFQVEDTQSLLNKSLDRVAQSSVELSRANQQLKRQETEIERIQNRLTETQCQLATKENELSMAETEIERLRVLIEGYKAMEKTMKREVSELDNEAEDEIASLNRQLDAAAVLLRSPERVTWWGYDG